MAPTRLCRTWLLCAGCLALLAVAEAPAQKDDRLPPPRVAPDDTPKGLSGPGILPPGYPGGLAPAVPVTLPDVLRLAYLANLDIAQAQLVLQRAQVNILRAQSLYLPNINMGSTYTTHDGTIQRT